MLGLAEKRLGVATSCWSATAVRPPGRGQGAVSKPEPVQQLAEPAARQRPESTSTPGRSRP